MTTTPDGSNEPASPVGEPAPSEPAAPGPVGGGPPPWIRRGALAAPLAVTVGVTAVVGLLSVFAPKAYTGTAVGVAFLAATWVLVLRHDESVIAAHGLSLGGLLEPTALVPARLVRAALGALGWALGLGAVVFPLFWLGFRLYHDPSHAFAWRPPPSLLDDVAGQLVVVALPEEAFYRGYLQTELDRAFPRTVRILGADVGLGLLVSAALFAAGHYLTIRSPERLAVFFPALVFGWLRARTGGIGAPVAFHALCNLLSATLWRGYHLPS